jgi:hypothetical protein
MRQQLSVAEETSGSILVVLPIAENNPERNVKNKTARFRHLGHFIHQGFGSHAAWVFR